MSSRLGQTTSRFIGNGNNNATNSSTDPGAAMESGLVSPNNNPQAGAGVLPNAFNYRSHRGHKRGHSYGGPSSQSAFHHVQLEARPSHPSAQHGYSSQNFTLPHKLVGPTHGSSVLHKGHRRALSGCLPMVGMGAVAWSSLRELEAPQPHPSFAPFRGLSPEESRPPSPDTTVADGRGSLKVPPVIPVGLGKENLEDYMECGLGPCQLPRCFQSLANIKFFVSILALLVTLQQAVASGYVNSVITTIEARFEIPSRFMGIVASAYEMGNVITVLFVSYLGAKRHIPRWIATGVLVMVIGCIVFSLPHFLASDPGNGIGKHSYINDKSGSSPSLSSSSLASQIHVSPLEDGKPKGGRNSMCKIASPQSLHYTSRSGNRSENDSSSLDGDSSTHKDVAREKLPGGDSGFANYLHFSAGCSIETVEEDGKKVTKTTEESYAQPFILFMIAQLLLGCGGSPLFTLGITYVDDHVPTESSSVYIGVVYAMAAFGPVLGFLTGAWLLTIPDYPGELGPDAQAVGMWWGGFLIAGILLFVACLPFFSFPRLMASSKTVAVLDVSETKETQYVIEESTVESSSVTQLSRAESNPDSGYGQSLKDIPRSIWRLITNPTYVVTCLGGCMELNIVSGFVVFLPKYLETQFSLGKSDASLYVGGIAIPGACLGIFAGGFVMNKLKLKPSGAAKFVVFTNLLCLIGYGLFFFLGCENPNLAGATTPYPGTLQPIGPLDVNLTSTCNVGCHCDSSLDAQFVCDKETQTTFFSACHAGCEGGNNTRCRCVDGDGPVVPGKCSTNRCHTLEAFMVILFFMTGTTAVTQMPLLMIVMRSVAAEERSFALGLQFVIFRLFGYIPSPIIFGNVIDSACILWSVKKCSTLLPAVRGRCLLYDVQDFRYKYVGVLSGLKLMALALFLYDFFQLRNLEKKEDEAASLAAAVALQAESLKLKSNSVISLDKLFEEVETGSGATVTTVATT